MAAKRRASQNNWGMFVNVSPAALPSQRGSVFNNAGQTLPARGHGAGRQSILATIGCEEKAAEEEIEEKEKVERLQGRFAQELQDARRAVVEDLERSLEELSRRLRLTFQEEMAAARHAARLSSKHGVPQPERAQGLVSPQDSCDVALEELMSDVLSEPETSDHPFGASEAKPPAVAMSAPSPADAAGGGGGHHHHPTHGRLVLDNGDSGKRLYLSDRSEANRSEGDRSALSLQSLAQVIGGKDANEVRDLECHSASDFGGPSPAASEESVDEAIAPMRSEASVKTTRSLNSAQPAKPAISFAQDDVAVLGPRPVRQSSILKSGTFGSDGGGIIARPSGARRDNGDSCFDNLLSFEVLDCWKKSRQLAAKLGNKLRKPVAPEELGLGTIESDLLEEEDSSVDSEDEGHRDVHRAKGSWKHLIWHPNCAKRGFWEILSLLLVVYDIIWIPFQLFSPPITSMVEAMDWVTRTFWTFDIVCTFITGYVTVNGFIEMRPRKIWLRYARSWLTLDVGLVSVDWLELVWGFAKGGGYFRFGRAARAFRIVRMVRLLRLLRVKEVVAMMFESVQSETIKEMSQMIKIVMLVLISGHMFACFWYGLGDSGVEQPSWPDITFTDHQTLIYRYIASLHWSLAQYTGGMDEIRPANVSERLYAICVLIFTLMVGTVLVSSLTSSMTHLNILANEKKTKMTMLRKYLLDNKITSRLTTRVQRNAQHALLEQQQYIPEAHVELLQLVSEPLRIELHFELYATVFQKHPFFAEYIDACPHIMHKVCHTAPSMVGVSAHDIIFNVSEIPPKPKMIFVTSGTLIYIPLAKAGGGGGRQSMSRKSLANLQSISTNGLPHGAIELEAGAWVAEPVLWTHWMHRGILTAKTDARLCLVDAQRFQDQVSAFDHDEFNPKVYATGYVDGLNKCDELSDLAQGIEASALAKLQNHMDRLAENKFASLHNRGRRQASVKTSIVVHTDLIF